MRSPHRRLSRNGVVVACEDGWQLIEELHAELRAIHFHLKALRAELKAVEKEVTELRAVEKEVTS
jgi:prefoldin subunit 5